MHVDVVHALSWYTCTDAVALEDRVAVELRCLYEPGVSMVCCRASAAAAVDVLVCLNHGNDILRRCDLSAAATWVSAKRGPPTRRCSGGIFDGVVLVVVGVAVFGAGAAAAAAASGTAAVDTSSARRPPPPELGAAIDQSGSPSTGDTRRSPLLDRSLAAATAAESCALCVCVYARDMYVRDECVCCASVRARVWYGPGRWWREGWMGGIYVELRGGGGASNGAPVAHALQKTRRGVESIVDGGRFRGTHVAAARGGLTRGDWSRKNHPTQPTYHRSGLSLSKNCSLPLTPPVPNPTLSHIPFTPATMPLSSARK